MLLPWATHQELTLLVPQFFSFPLAYLDVSRFPGGFMDSDGLNIAPHLLFCPWFSLPCFEGSAFETQIIGIALWIYHYSLSALLAVSRKGKREIQEALGKNTSANFPKYYPAACRLQGPPWTCT